MDALKIKSGRNWLWIVRFSQSKRCLLKIDTIRISDIYNPEEDFKQENTKIKQKGSIP